MKNNNLQDIDKSYVSKHDEFLQNWDKKHKKSESQLKEMKKYKKIFALRDNAKKD